MRGGVTFLSVWEILEPSLPPSPGAFPAGGLRSDDSDFKMLHFTWRELEIYLLSFFGFFFFFLIFLGPYLQHMEVPRIAVKSELQLPAYATATAIQDPSPVCSLYHSSWQRWILNPLSEVRDRTPILIDTSQVCYGCATMGTPWNVFYIFIFYLLCSPKEGKKDLEPLMWKMCSLEYSVLNDKTKWLMAVRLVFLQVGYCP